MVGVCLPAWAQTESVLVNLTGTSGAAPGKNPGYGNLIQASDGNFYGTTSIGGSSSDGTVFKISSTGTYTLLHSFAGGTSDGSGPNGSLVQGTDGNFYGTTGQGGSGGLGTVFKITSSGTVTLLHSFAGGTSDGSGPNGGLVQGTDGNFYGTTYAGGAHSDGAVFEMNSASPYTVTLLHSFAGGSGDGQWPNAGLVQGTDGNFYGTTTVEGSSGGGTLFSINSSGSTYTQLHSFAGATGSYATGALVQGTDGTFYGTTQGGGAHGDGTVFNINSSGSTYTVLRSFAGGTTDGSTPYAGLVEGTDGNFYGTTYSGGANNYGTVFSINASGSTFTLLHSMGGGSSDGKWPYAGLVQGADGNFYGTAYTAGSSSDGVIFKQTPASILAAPVALSVPASVTPGGTFTLTYSVANAYNTSSGYGTLEQCFATNTAGDTTVWKGILSGSPSNASVSPTASSTQGTYTYTLTCGGMESSVVTVQDYNAPTVTGVSPTSGLSSGGTSVTVTGTNFTAATAVTFGTTAAASFVVNSSTSITAVAPATASSGAVDITVTNPGETSATSSADQFTYTQTTSTLTLGASPASSTYGANVTLTATVNNTAAGGSVTFNTSTGLLGTGTVTNGVATLVTTSLPIGTDSVTAIYSGDSGDTGSTSNTVTITVSVMTTAVGSTSATQQVAFKFTTTVTLNSTLSTAIQVVTQGVTNLDFQYVAGGTCAAGTTYTNGQTCTVNFTFSPKAAGPRLGAVVLYNNAATPAVVLTDFFYGLGSGPQALYQNGTKSVYKAIGTTTENENAIDAAGNIYYTTYSNPGGVYKIAAGGGAITTLYGSTTVATGIAVDGAGNVFYNDVALGKVYELVGGSGLPVVVATVSDPEGLCVDTSGNIYVSSRSSNTVLKFLAGTFTASTVYGSSLPSVYNAVVDSSGHVYVTDFSGGNIYKFNSDGTGQTAVVTGLSSQQPSGMSLDAAGNLYVAFLNAGYVEKFAAGTYTGTILTGTTSKSFYVLLDGNGTMYVSDPSNSQIVSYTRTTGGALSFASTAVGATAAAQTLALENDGNASLTIASIAPSTSSFGYAGAVVGSNAACGSTLASGGVCGLSATFAPQSVGALSANGLVTDNNLNTTGSTQTVALTGTGTIGTKTISFTAPASPASAGTTATLVATASNGDPVTFSVNNVTGTASIIGSTITYLSAGTVRVTANSAATSTYNAATAGPDGVTITALTIPVGSTSATLTATVTISTGGTLNAIYMLTQGVSNLDFKLVSGGTCAIGTTYTASQTCTVAYTFGPTAPGVREGAISLTTSSNAIIGTAYMGGVGTGPQAVIYPGVQTQLSAITGFGTTFSMVTDGAGNLYVGDFSNGDVKKYTISGTTATLVNTFTLPSQSMGEVAVDGAGNVYMAGIGYDSVYRSVYNPATGAYGTPAALVNLGVADCFGAAVDTAGNVYGACDGNIYKATLSGGTYGSAVNIVNGGTSSTLVTQMVVDLSGNIYYVDAEKGYVEEATYSSGSYSAANLVTGYTNPNGLVLDGAGDIYISSSTNTGITRLTPNGSGGYNASVIGTGVSGINGVALSPNGNLFVNNGSSTVYIVDVADAPTEAFSSTAVGSTSSTMNTLLENIGSSSLTFSSLAASTTNFSLNGATTCSTGTPLAAAGNCTLSAQFTPQTSGSLTGTLIVTDNSLNMTGSQTENLSGTATAASGATSQTITFTQPSTPVVFGTAPITLSVSSTSGLAVNFTVTSGPATVSGSTLTFTGTGSVVVTANQGGNATYAAATPVARTIVVSSLTSNLGVTSATQTANVTFTAAGTPSTISVVTQGATGLDFAYVSGGTCSTITAYVIGQSCTVLYTFSPKFAGNRAGAVTLSTSAGTVLGTAYVAGTGTGPEAVIYPGTQTTLLSGFSSDAFGIAIDASNDLYLFQGSTITKETYNSGSGTYSATSLGSSLGGGGSFGVDGAGNVYAPSGSSIVRETLNPVSQTYTQSTIYSGSTSYSVTADNAGNVYNGAGSTLVKLTPTSSGTYTATTISSAFGGINGMAADASGNVYLCDSSYNALYKETYSGSSYALSVIATGLSNCNGVTVDAAGTVYAVANGTTTAVLRYAPNGSSYTQLASVGNIGRGNGVVVDGSGNLYITNDSGGNSIVKIAVSTPETLTFASTAAGASSSAMTAAVNNIGTSALTFSALATSSTNFTLDATTTTCSTGSTLASAGTCNIGAKFTPQTAGSLSGTFNVTDNSLNATGSVQQATLAGTGTYAQPTITNVSPAAGAITGGTTVTITGTNLTGITTVKFGGTNATSFILGSNTSLTAVSPAGSSGTVDITVANASYTSATSSSDQYIYQTVPAITWIPSAVKVYSGAAIGAGVLNASSTTAGTFAYTATIANGSPVAVTAASTLAVGSYTLTANFTPTDGVNNTTATMTQSITAQNMNPFVINSGGTVSSDYNSGGNASAATSGGGIGAAVDSNGYVWSINTNGSSVSKFTDAGALSVSYSGASMSGATALAIDGKGVVWIANGGGTISVLTNAGAADASPAITSEGKFSTPSGIAIDTAGSVWVTNSGNGTVVEVIGAAAPVVAPVVSGVTNSTLGARP